MRIQKHFPLLVFCFGFIIQTHGQVRTYAFEDTVVLTGEVIPLTYEMPSGELLNTFILQLDEEISHVDSIPGEQWFALDNVREAHLNASYSEIEPYCERKVLVKGVLFHALNIHHRRSLCIRVFSLDSCPSDQSNYRVGKTETRVYPDSTKTVTRYLGIATVGGVKYHTTTRFYTIRTASSFRGRSQLVFVSVDCQTFKTYNFNLPDELPKELHDNHLIFESEKFSLNELDFLPEVLCVPNLDCYE